MRIGDFHNAEDVKIFHDYWYAQALKMRNSQEFVSLLDSRYDDTFGHPDRRIRIKLPADYVERKRS